MNFLFPVEGDEAISLARRVVVRVEIPDPREH